MTRDETKRIIFLIANTYPNFKPADMSVTVDIWTKLFEEYPYAECERALHSYMSLDTSGFAPVPGQIIEKMHIAEHMNEMTGLEAWSLVSRALRDSTYHAKERFEELPLEVKRAVGSAENLKAWGQDEGYNENVAQSIFIKNYNNVLEQKHELERLPQNVAAMISGTTQKMIEG